jgi:hypothetical protein
MVMLPRRRVIMLATAAAILLGIAGLAAASYIAERGAERARIVEFRRSVFCELITPGMARTDVESILSRYGPFTETESSTGDFVVIYLSFDEPDVRERFGGTYFVLGFDGGEFHRATMPRFSDAYEPVCEPPP